MAMIQCTECGRDVSDKALACVGCGAPITTASEIAATGKPVVTTELTSKRFKGQIAAGTLCAVLGIMWLISASNSGSNTLIPTLMLIGGFAWVAVARIRAWWHHG